MTDEDIARIIKMHISPINISVHATNPELRVELMKTPQRRGAQVYPPAGRAPHPASMPKSLSAPASMTARNCGAACGIWVSTPRRCKSIALVPVGLTGHREGLYPLRMMEPEEAADCIRIADEFGEEMLRRHGSRIAFCADELYLIAGLPLPDYSYYEDFDQLGNGVGTTALCGMNSPPPFPWKTAMRRKVTSPLPLGRPPPLFCGSFWKLQRKNFPHRQLTVYGVPNITFGGGVNVTGLVCGRDIIEYLRDKPLYQGLILPEIMLRDEKDKFLDDTTPTMSPKHCKPPFMWPAWMALIS